MIWALLPSRRRARRAERYIDAYEFPSSVPTKFEGETEDLAWEPVEQGLREWLICCAYRRRARPLGMPSRAVDYAWHAFILDTAAYRDFCDQAYGRFLDHIPETAMTDGSRANVETVWAWDRSQASRAGDSILWNLDDDLELEDPLGIDPEEVVRARTLGASSGAWLGFDAAGGCGGGGCGGGGCGGGGCGGGG
jgi:hypothetical protein